MWYKNCCKRRHVRIRRRPRSVFLLRSIHGCCWIPSKCHCRCFGYRLKMHDGINKQVNIRAWLQYVSDYMKRMQAASPSFFHEFQGDSGNVFWTDAAFQANYTNFGDTVRIDTSYRANRLKLPFVTFTGINHHAQPVLFGCGLLLNESENTFIWLLQTWLQAMSGRSSPVSVTTDPDQLVQMAVAQVLPDAHHRFCRWSLLSQTQEKLAHVYQTNPTFDIEFKNCINEASTVEEFESCWAALVDRYFLMDNEWLQSVYRIRDQWIPVYMRGVFFGELFPGEHNGGTSLFFDGFVSNTTNTVQLLMKQYEKAISSWQEKELKEEFDTSNAAPVLKTPSPMEKQAANLYTRRVFIKFQEELVETLANPATMIDGSTVLTSYRVSKFGEEHKAHTVRFNLFEMKATCTCRMLEFSGIICRHVLSVFRAKNVLTLPSDYVLKRWTKNAKTNGGLSTSDNAALLPNNDRESRTTRRDNLRQEAMRYIEEGAKSIHSYNMAMSALQEASKRVAAVESKNSGAMQSTDAADEGNLETHVIENQSAAPLSKEEKEKKIQELTSELESTNQRSEVYRAILLALFKDMEDQNLKLSIKVQNARLTLKE
ncbi:protein FAR1-RELATED SEQUENCE 9-like isoform X1 [Primulina eburnea]|uniref:protein FAR1-RELATED SEQUENCE 9-like isoform X1 n=1 Tax=Primulina eburnea TaxID=1245227 RepID=UPI003C6C6D81